MTLLRPGGLAFSNMAGSKFAWVDVKVKKADLTGLRESVKLLAESELLVGFPEGTTERPDDGSTPEITNAALGYIHDHGAPENNIPARPFMIPAIRENLSKVADLMEGLAVTALTKRSPLAVVKGLTQVGLFMATAIKRKINEGIPPPLSDYTLRQRAGKGRKGAKEELLRRAKGENPSMEFAKPLVDTGQLRNAVNFVIRPRRRT